MAKKMKARKRRLAIKRKPAAKAKAHRKHKAPARRKRGSATPIVSVVAPLLKGLGAIAGGQSGDVQGLSEAEGANSESVSELAEEGQDFEAGIISGVENAPDADQGEVTTHEVPENDVPPEYLERD
jgi:N utilization substance protein A